MLGGWEGTYQTWPAVRGCVMPGRSHSRCADVDCEHNIDLTANALADLAGGCDWSIQNRLGDRQPYSVGVTRSDSKDVSPFPSMASLGENPLLPLLGSGVCLGGARERLSNGRTWRSGGHRASRLLAGCDGITALVQRRARVDRRDPRCALSASHDACLQLSGGRARAQPGGPDRAEARLRRGRRLAPPPRFPPLAQRRAVRASPRGLVDRRCVLLLADLPVDLIVVLEQEERAGQRERIPGALCECRCPSETEHVFVR
jgi:hypothetical protein